MSTTPSPDQEVLRVTLVDVGWGDSLLVEAKDADGTWHYGLIDSNDTSTLRSSHIFLKRFFERRIRQFRLPDARPVFDWVLLSHAHADHGQGLKKILRDYGTRQLWYPKTHSAAVFFTDLLRYAGRSTRVQHHQAIDSTKSLPGFGQATMQILWPPHNTISSNENNNSVVLLLEVGDISMVLTGDAEADVWASGLAAQLPSNVIFFKVPHHGSENGVFHHGGTTPWLDQVPASTCLAISSHIRPFSHPSDRVVAELDARGVSCFRTDEHYHVTVGTDGVGRSVKYSHV